ncbi:putative erythromycin esterase [Golovinomyces cichoracearum]|uniref:Putative erythromycin esterase n=1 Tax=Golovinomyces cichoracearum TaxID=62708 RepID=A0A420HHD0_9PEZI|nr:putative erythromycin esterase [Golovinomyces cichoracearum]
MVPRRRSSRLRSATPLKQQIHSSAQLGSVMEYDEGPIREAQPNNQSDLPIPKTPLTASPIKPALEEMHPSKVHPSTTQDPDSGLRLGFTDIKAEGNSQPSGITQQTPSKISVVKSPFDVKFARSGPRLGPEAQRMMDELHEETLRIKARLAAEREEEKRTDSNVETRKLAKPRSKAGRFSGAHLAEFKKMDSIAGHPSAFRAQSSRTAPVKSSLKRSPSKAQLDDQKTMTGKDSRFKKDDENRDENDRNQNNISMKRARRFLTDDISSASRNNSKPLSSCSRSRIPGAISNPTNVSLSRGSSSKVMHKYQSSLKSPHKANLNIYLKPETNFAALSSTGLCPSNNNFSPSKLKHIELSGSGTETSNNTMALSNLSCYKSKYDLHEVFSAIPSTPVGIKSYKNTKLVNFTPTTINKHAVAAQNSPSPMKSNLARPVTKINFDVKSTTSKIPTYTTNTNEVIFPSVSKLRDPDTLFQVKYPPLPNDHSPHQTTAQYPQSTAAHGSFTFRSNQTMKLGSSSLCSESMPAQGSPQKLANGHKSEISLGNFPVSGQANEKMKYSLTQGISTKRRKRPDTDDDQIARGPSFKRPKNQEIKSLTCRNGALKSNLGKIPSPKKKPGVLSLSRLNILSRPRIRK